MYYCCLILGFVLRPNVITCRNNAIRSSVYMNDTLIHSLEPPSGGELKLLTSLNAESWAYNWIMYISSPDTEDYDEHFYMDYFNMRGMANMYTSPEYFYFGYFTDKMIGTRGPKYIGLFHLDKRKRILSAKLIMENPYDISQETRLREFKTSIINLTDTAFVFFKIEDLNRPEQIRYYYSWKYK